MFVLRLYASEDLRPGGVPELICGTDEVKIRVKNCSTCGTDVKIRKNGHQNLTPPRIVGHEIVGEMVGASFGVAGDWKPGDRVQVIVVVSCGKCHECQKEWMAVCQNQISVGYQYDGGFVRYMIVPRKVLAVDGMNRILDRVGFAEASAAESFAYAISAQEQLGIELGDDVVIPGAGPTSCLHVRTARGVHRAGRIILVDISSEQLKMSADAVKLDIVTNAFEVNIVEGILKLTGGRGADMIIIATPVSITQEQATPMAAHSGRISSFGGLPKMNPTITLGSSLVHYWRPHIHGANGSAPEYNRRALDYIVSGEVSAADLIIHYIRLRDVMDAFGIVEHGEATKVIVEP